MSIAHKNSRPQVERIERLPRRLSNEPRESMNCKSCRRRKIKCNRLRPTCEACQVFATPCIYDAVPKKRGPKTDVLEALVKRIDGLEKRLKEEGKAVDKDSENGISVERGDDDNSKPERPIIDTEIETLDETAVYSPTPTAVSEPSPTVLPDVLLDTYFSRVHGKPYHILDETSTRQRLQQNQIPDSLLHALYAVGARYSAHPKGYSAAVSLSNYHASLARTEIDLDEPSVDGMQTCLLLTVAFTAAGKGKKTYMMLSNAVGMAMALDLHREVDSRIRITPVEREMRRRLFWTCYIMDRFIACGSKRPCLISDKSIMLKLPSWSPNPSTLPLEGEFFQTGSNLQYHAGSGKQCQGSSGMLIDIVRILGITNRYLAAGGVKGDSHFPWHSLSNLSQIRQDLDIWASGTQDVFSSVETLFGQSDSTSLVLSKLIYHLIHCLIYRPFLPIDLLELAGTGQHQSWQIEATHLCFLHANAIAELVELGKQSQSIEWNAFVGYCICTAGTVHVHGAHYKGGRDGEVFSASADFLSREMQQLSELRYSWTSVQHQRETLQTIYGCHSELVKSLSSNPMRYSPVFHLEDFFDRYSTLEQYFDGAHISFADVVDGLGQEAYTGHDLYAMRNVGNNNNGTGCESSSSTQRKVSNSSTSAARRKFSTNSRSGKRVDVNGNGALLSPSPNGNGMHHQLPLQSNHLGSNSNSHSLRQQQQRLVGLGSIGQQHQQNIHMHPTSSPTNSHFGSTSQRHLQLDLNGTGLPFSPPYHNPFDSPPALSSHSHHNPFDSLGTVFDVSAPTLSSQGNPNQHHNHNQNQNHASSQGPTSNPSSNLHNNNNHNPNGSLSRNGNGNGSQNGGLSCNMGLNRLGILGGHQMQNQTQGQGQAQSRPQQQQQHFFAASAEINLSSSETTTPPTSNSNGRDNSSMNGDGDGSASDIRHSSDDDMRGGDMRPLGEEGEMGEMQVEEDEMDPFLSLLEQLVENERERGGPSECELKFVS